MNNRSVFSTHHRIALAAALAIAGIAPAAAHDAFIETVPKAYRILFGHDVATATCEPDKLGAVAAFDADGKPLAVAVAVDRGTESATVTPAGDAAMLTVEYDNGFWSKDAEGKSVNRPKTETGAKEGTRARKYGKTMLHWSPASRRPTGQVLEIVPLTDAAPAAGGTLPVQVLHDGKPLAQAPVMIGGHDGAKTVTDADGKTVVTLGPTGTQMITTALSLPWQGPEADKLNLSANLRFEAK